MSPLRLLKLAVCAAGLLFLGSYLFVAASRIGYPFELEWMEGAMADHVARVRAGQPLFVAPSVDWAPLLYPPFYYYCAGVLSRLVGEGFVALRLLSFLASIGCCGLIFLLVWRETRARTPSFLAACLFVATFEASGQWLDLGRVDSLFLLLLLWASYLSRGADTAPRAAAAGIVLAVAFCTKQTAIVFGLPIGLWLLKRRPRIGLVFGLAFVVFAGGSYGFGQWQTKGWYDFYLRQLPSLHPWARAALPGFWLEDIVATLPVATGLIAGWLVLGARRDREQGDFALALLAGGLGASWLSRLHEGGWDNVLLPAYGAMSVGLGLALQTFLSALSMHPALPAAVLSLCLVQFLLLRYSPVRCIPTEADRRAGRSLVAHLRELDGPVFVPSHGWLATMAGKRPSIHLSAFLDIVRVETGEARRRLIQDLQDALGKKRYAAIVLDESLSHFAAGLESSYRLHGEVFDDPAVFYPVTGARTRPRLLYLRR